MRTQNRILLVLMLCCVAGYVAADTTLADFTGTLLAGGDVLTKVLWAASIIVGICLIAAAFTQFQIHRRNPKLVPLTTPVLYLILGLGAVALPFIHTVSNFLGAASTGGHTAPATKATPAPAAGPKTNTGYTDIDAPM